MNRHARRRPSPAMIVAMIALCLGLGGSAIAAGGDITKKQVKKIANKQIKKKAILKKQEASLNVNSAKTATNAEQLGGKAASAYVSSGPQPFKPIALLNGWTQQANGAVPGYWIDPFGVVHFQGSIAGSNNSVVATLPAEATPAKTRGFAVPCAGTDGDAFAEFQADGELRVFEAAAGSSCDTFAYFDGIEYRLDN